MNSNIRWCVVIICLPFVFDVANAVDSFVCKNANILSSTNITRVNYICAFSTPVQVPEDGNDSLWIDIYNCNNLPGNFLAGLRTRNLLRLVLSAPEADNQKMTTFSTAIVRDLSRLNELQLWGFENLRNIHTPVLKSLSSLQCLYLNGFGADFLKLTDLSALIGAFWETPLKSIAMNGTRSSLNIDNDLSLATFFPIPNRNVTHFSIDDSGLTELTGRLSLIFPSLQFLSLSLYITNAPVLNSGLDALLFLNDLKVVNIYGYPIVNVGYSKAHLKYIPDMAVVRAMISRRDTKCFWNYRIPLSSHVISLTLSKFNVFSNPFFASQSRSPICFVGTNSLEVLDVSGTSFPRIVPPIVGLKHLKFMNIRNTQITQISSRQLSECPVMETLLLGNNNLRDGIASDTDAEIFQYGSMVATLDLGNCNLVAIPPGEFRSLVSLKYLNLSSNNIQNINLLLPNSTQLMNLNLSYNAIENIPQQFIATLNSIVVSECRSKDMPMEIDFTGNPLSCLCNATDFVDWIQSGSSTGINFSRLSDYTCLYSNGSTMNMSKVNTEQVRTECAPIKIPGNLINDTDCPCDLNQLNSLYPIRFALYQYFCIYPDKTVMRMSNLNLTTMLNICGNPYTSARFVGSTVAGAAVLVIAILIVSFIVYYKRSEKNAPIRAIMKMNPSKIPGALITLLMSRKEAQSESATAFDYDVFASYAGEEYATVKCEIISELSKLGLNVITEDENFLGGGAKLDALLESIARCRFILLVISPRFMACDWCREVTIRATARQHAIVPLIYRPLEQNDEDMTLSDVIKTCRPVVWPECPDEKSKALNELHERLTGDINVQIVKTLFNDPGAN